MKLERTDRSNRAAKGSPPERTVRYTLARE
jgi:hypothetical protein